MEPAGFHCLLFSDQLVKEQPRGEQLGLLSWLVVPSATFWLGLEYEGYPRTRALVWELQVEGSLCWNPCMS